MVKRRTLRIGWTCFLLLALGRISSAQESTGALYGVVRDATGGVLPGATITLSGFGETKIQTSDQLGRFWFRRLDPGTWSLVAKLDGFSSVDYPTIDIDASRNTTIQLELSAAVEEIITVTAASPLLDERKLATGTTITQAELDNIPTGRNLWALLTQAPGVLSNRVDVGDAFSADQSVIRGQGVYASQNDFILDGMQIRSVVVGGGGSTDFYMDLDQLEEIQVVTGGNDVTKTSSGVAVSAVTKRGSNELRGSARFLLTDRDGYFGVLEEAESGFDPADLGPGQDDFVADSIVRTQEYGFEAGGPAWRDRVWLWGAWSRKDLNNIRGGGEPNRITLENTAVKLNAQLGTANSLVASYSDGAKVELATFAGLGIDASAILDLDGETGITIVEDSHVFGSSFFASASYAKIHASGIYVPRGGSGPDRPPSPAPGGEANIDADGVLTNNITFGLRPRSEELKLDASYFANSGTVSHELRFGGRLRSAETIDFGSYPGRNLLHYDGGYFGVQDPGLLALFGLPPDRFMDAHVVLALRSGSAPVTNDFHSLWIQDTLTWTRWTVNVGLRFDNQQGENQPATVPANFGFPEVMPAIEFAGNDGGGLDWTTLSPRLGVTYALGEERTTLLRGSLSQYPDAMSAFDIARVNPVTGQTAAILFLDEPGGFPSFYDDGEPFEVFPFGIGFDPSNPVALTTPNITDPNTAPAKATELILGVEHALLPQFVLGAGVTWRWQNDLTESQGLFEDEAGEIRTAGAGEYDFDRTIEGILPDGSGYEVDTFAVDPSLTPTGGRLLTSGDRDIDSLAVTLKLTKRLSNGWMLRGFANYFVREEWGVPMSYFDHADPNKLVDGGNRNGAPFAPAGGTSASSSTWQWNLNGMYQIAPERAWGFNLAANLTGRQGFPIPYFERVAGSDQIVRQIGVADSLTDFRYDDVFTADVRLEKEFAAATNTSLTFSIDGFNLLNDGTVLARVTNLASPFSEWVESSVHPRVWRLGVRLNWR